MQITYFGHSCFHIQIEGINLLFDPFITPNPLAANININTIQADYILVSHAHNDHTADLLHIAERTNATVIGIWEVHIWLQKMGIPNTHPMNIGGSWKFDFGTVKMVNAVHSSSFPDGSIGGSPAGFVIDTKDGKFYYAGDTALHHDMKILGKYHKIDFAFLPVGDNFTMGVTDALIASKFIKCDTVIGMHYDTFGFIKIDHDEAKRKFKDEEKKLILMKIEDTMEM
ncbi:MAG: metal-dependent hydrolase [Chitinophagales bacterium]|nr:metal-dependent hydrolase [Chitinophagales bacterium]